MRDSNNSDYVVFNEIHERVWIRWQHVTMSVGEILRSLRGSVGDLVNRVIKLAQVTSFCRLAALAIPCAVFFNLGDGVLEELETH